MDEMGPQLEALVMALLAAAGVLALGLALIALVLGWRQGRDGAWRAAACMGAVLALGMLVNAALAIALPWRSPMDPIPALLIVVTGPLLAGHAAGVMLALARRPRGG